jgi:hypothetical protein
MVSMVRSENMRILFQAYRMYVHCTESHAREVDGIGSLGLKTMNRKLHTYKTTKIEDKEKIAAGDKNKIPRRQK